MAHQLIYREASPLQGGYKQRLTVNSQGDVDCLLLRHCRVCAVAGVDASVVGVVHLERDDAPGHAVVHLCAGGQLCVGPVPGERGRRVAAL